MKKYVLVGVGGRSVMFIAANKSMATNQAIDVSKLVKDLPEPLFPQMPGENESISFTPDVSRMAGGQKMDANVPLKLEAPE